MRLNHILMTITFMTLFLSAGNLAAEVVDRVVAIVNEDVVTQFDIEKQTAPYIKNINKGKYSQAQKEQLIQKVRQDALNMLIERALTSQEAKRYGISISDAEVDEAIERIKQQKNMTQEMLEGRLELEGTEVEEFREDLRKQMLQSRIINYAVKLKTVVTDSDIKAYYQANADKYAGQKKYYLRNLLMTDKDKILEVEQKLKNNESFEQLAKSYSIAPNAAEGGDLGLFDINDFSGKIKESLSPLKKGEFTPILESSQGLQIFFVQDIVIEGQKDYEEAAKEIEDILYRQEVEKQFKTWLDGLKENAHIKTML